MPLPNDELAEDRRNAHRAIGAYVVAFSQLMRAMRCVIGEFIVDDDLERIRYTDIVLGEAPAATLSHAFFGLCREATRYSEAEAEIAGQLQREIEESIIPTRNDIAHGDWDIVSDEPSAPKPPTLTRIIPHRKASPYKIVPITVETLDEMTDRIERLARIVEEFGRLALGLSVQHENKTSRGELRIQDVFIVPGSRKSREKRAVSAASKAPRSAAVTRTGPLASEVVAPSYIFLTEDDLY